MSTASDSRIWASRSARVIADWCSVESGGGFERNGELGPGEELFAHHAAAWAMAELEQRDERLCGVAHVRQEIGASVAIGDELGRQGLTPTGSSAENIEPVGGKMTESVETCTMGSQPAAIAAPSTMRVPGAFTSRALGISSGFSVANAAEWTQASQPSRASATDEGSRMSPTTASMCSGSMSKKAHVPAEESGTTNHHHSHAPPPITAQPSVPGRRGPHNDPGTAEV
jgi:hypothetical protein